jgi:transposase
VRVVLSHRIALVPTARQELLLRQAVGVSRFAYNWALAEWKRQYQAGEKPSEVALRRQLNSIKRQQFPWMRFVPKSVPQQAIKNCGAAFRRYTSRSRAAILSSRRKASAIPHASTMARAPLRLPASESACRSLDGVE